MAGGQLLHGLVHPEAGHLRLPRVDGDTFKALAYTMVIAGKGFVRERRSGSGRECRPKSCRPTTLRGPTRRSTSGMRSPTSFARCRRDRVIVGGSVSKGGQLGEEAFFRAVRQQVQAVLNGYVVSPALLGDGIHEYIVPPQLGDDAGVCGAIALGQCAHRLDRPLPARRSFRTSEVRIV